MIDRSWPPGSADVPVGSHFEWVADGDVGAPRVADLWPSASPVTRNNAVLQLRLQYFALPVATIINFFSSAG